MWVHAWTVMLTKWYQNYYCHDNCKNKWYICKWNHLLKVWRLCSICKLIINYIGSTAVIIELFGKMKKKSPIRPMLCYCVHYLHRSLATSSMPLPSIPIAVLSLFMLKHWVTFSGPFCHRHFWPKNHNKFNPNQSKFK